LRFGCRHVTNLLSSLGVWLHQMAHNRLACASEQPPQPRPNCAGPGAPHGTWPLVAA
jgi:hypothetical protein